MFLLVFPIPGSWWQPGDAVDIFADLEDDTLTREEARNVLRTRKDLDPASLDALFK